MAATNVRVKDSIVGGLKGAADRFGMSLQGLVDEILEREVAMGPLYATRPIALPPGLLAIADLAFDKAKQGGVLAVLYTAPNGTPVLVAGDVKNITPMTLTIQIWQNQRPMSIPRAEIVAWEHIQGVDPLQAIYQLARTYQIYGAVLHPLVTIPNREAHGL